MLESYLTMFDISCVVCTSCVLSGLLVYCYVSLLRYFFCQDCAKRWLTLTSVPSLSIPYLDKSALVVTACTTNLKTHFNIRPTTLLIVISTLFRNSCGVLLLATMLDDT